jgi:hypothetical protein
MTACLVFCACCCERHSSCLPGGQDGTWAGQQEQVALAREQGLRLRIYQAGQPSWVLAPGFPDFPEVAPRHR